MKHNIKLKFTLLFIVAVILAAITVSPNWIKAQDSLDLNAESAILVDFNSGKILYGKNIDAAIPPASMTKMMTEYLVLEAIKNGEITWDTTTKISDYAYSISANVAFSGFGLRQDWDYTVEELYQAMAIYSDNATTIALAELIAGSEGEFVKMMNQKAEEMGLTEYKFVNSTGLDNADLAGNHPEGTNPDDLNLLSARSTALLAYNLVKDYPEVLDTSSIPLLNFRGDPAPGVNWNWMLPHEGDNLEQFYYEGVDGLKTGYTDSGGNSFTSTAIRNGTRLISVVMRTVSKEERFEETAKLLDYGFNNFQTQELFAKGYQLDGQSTLPVAKGKEDAVGVSLGSSISVPVKSEDAELYSIEYQINEDNLNEDGKLTAPIEKGEVIGSANIVYEGEKDLGYIANNNMSSVPLVTDDSVEKANWFMLTLGAIGDFFANIFTSTVDWIKGLFS